MKLPMISLLVLWLAGCGSPAASAADGGALQDSAPTDPWLAVTEVLAASDIQNLTMLIGDATGEVYVYEKGDSTADRVYELASGSKWLAAASIMQLVEDGVMSLDDRPQDYIPWWGSGPTDPRRSMTLRHLLSFTSGFQGDALAIPCVADGTMTLEDCARQIHDGFFTYTPGETFFYGPPHLQVAGLMAQMAAGEPFVDVYRRTLTMPLGMNQTAYALASQQNPRVAGGAVSTAREYGFFLRALLSGDILADSAAVMRQDHTANATLAYSPIANGLGYEWHYALGSWRECISTTWLASCDPVSTMSSAGLYGWYPWIDVDRGYWGVLAMRLRLGVNGRPTVRSINLALEARALIEQALSQR